MARRIKHQRRTYRQLQKAYLSALKTRELHALERARLWKVIEDLRQLIRSLGGKV